MVPFLQKYLTRPSGVELPERDHVLSRIARSKRALLIEKISILRELAPKNMDFSLTGAAVLVSALEPSPEFMTVLTECITALIPWRKGPFQLFDIDLDAEWRCDRKWDRLALSRADVRGKKILDVGCGNGYYLFRLCGLDPELVVGFDPTDRYLLQYLLVRVLLPECLPIVFEPLRSSAISAYENYFDISFCLGVLYHHPEPSTLLSELYLSLKPGGICYLETLYSPLKHSLQLSGKSPYARMRNVHLIPTLSHARELLCEAGFCETECISAEVLSTEEQRRTKFSPGDSLEQFLSDSLHTVEGYFRPHRAIFRSKR